MKDSTRKILIAVGVALLVVIVTCGGLGIFAYWKMTACIAELEEPVETVVAELPCPSGGRVEVVNLRTTTNWLEGVYRNEAFLRYPPIGADVPVTLGGFRDFLPEAHTPAYRIDGDASVDGFQVYLDPSVVPAAGADALEACLIGRADELMTALRLADALHIPPDPSTPTGVVYWRASREDLEVTFSAPTGETIELSSQGSLGLHVPGRGTTIGEVTRGEDGTLEVTVDYNLYASGLSTTPVSSFRTDTGETLEQWFGVPPTVAPGTPP